MKKLILVVFICLFLSFSAVNVSAGWFDEVQQFFAKRGNQAPEFQCTVNFVNTQNSGLIQVSKECEQYFLAHGRLGQICQLYTYNETKGISQCNFCLDRYLSKTNKNIPKDCLEVKIEKSHFSEQEIKKIVQDNKEIIDEEMGKIDCSKSSEVGRITFVQGRAFIQRSSRIIPATVGEVILPGDAIAAEDGSEAILQLNSNKQIKISEKTRLVIPACETEEKIKGRISSFFGNIWTRTRNFLSGVAFKVKELTGAVGVRG
ncbi:MAG: hypothetical protein HQ564_05360 [Candidatus Saganbacteria bacterium]|nr:hypothetical protein [Candidatus Saganbacteria bacterium]